MEDKKKSVEEILPTEELKNLDKYADHSKSPMHDLKDKRDVLKDAKSKTESDK